MSTGVHRAVADRATLSAHFAVPASRKFVRTLQLLAAGSTTLKYYDAMTLENLQAREIVKHRL